MSQGHEKSEKLTDARRSRDLAVRYMINVLNMKQIDVARIIGVTTTTIYHILRDTRLD